MSAKKKTTKGTQDGSGKKVAPRSADDRSGHRVPIQLLVDYKAGGNYLFDFCFDLGTGGVFIQTEKPQKVGSEIQLTFTIPDSKETLKAQGTVIWFQDKVKGRPDLVPGMGVQFKGFTSKQRHVLESFVARYHGDRLQVGGAEKRQVS